jgi:MFS family permease
MQWVVVVTAIQEAVRDDMQARVAGFFEAIATAAPGVGFMLGGVLAQVFTPRVAFATAGFGVLLVVLLGGSVWVLRRGTRDVVAVRADHPLAAIDVPIAEVGTVAMSEVAAAPTLPHVP